MSIHKDNYGLIFLLKWPVCKKPEWKKMIKKNPYLIWKLYTIDHPNKFSWKSLSNNLWQLVSIEAEGFRHAFLLWKMVFDSSEKSLL